MTLVMAGLAHMWLRLIELMVIFRDGYSVWWPTYGVLLGVLLATRRRHWAWILLGYVIGNQSTNLSELAVGATDSACNVLEAVIPALVLPRFRTMDKWLAQPQVTPRFLLIAMLAAPLTMSLVAPVYYPSPPGTPYWLSVLRWFGSDVLGVAIGTPLLLSLLSPETWRLFRPPELAKTLGMLALMTAVGWLIFGQHTLPITFLAYPVILLMATQMGLNGAAIGINILAVIGAVATVRGEGPFIGAPGARASIMIVVMQAFLAMGISMTMPTSVGRVRRLTAEARLQRAWQEMQRLAEADGLTGVANRRRFDSALAAEWSRAKRHRSPLALLLIDADHFKAYNDHYGHLAGDACLRAIAQAVAGVPGRATDLVARYGGEEFAVLLPGSDAAGARTTAEAVREKIWGLHLAHGFNEDLGRVTVSIGAVSMVPDGEIAAELIAAADLALYQAKRGGRNRVALSAGVLV